MPIQYIYSTKTFLQVFVFLLFTTLCCVNTLAATADGRWHAGIGDPSVYGWMTVALYCLVALRCLHKAWASHHSGGSFRYWLMLFLFLMVLGVNKQLDLQTLVTQSLRDMSIKHGWYEQRRGVQAAFIFALGIGLLIALISLRVFLVNVWHHHKLTWFGLMLLCSFIVLRAASFHHFDLAIAKTLLGVKWNVILEIGALFIILGGTFVKHRVSSFKMTKLSEINPIVQIDYEGDVARCPQCGKQSVATTVHDRKFKCRRCGFFYKVHVTGKAVT